MGYRLCAMFLTLGLTLTLAAVAVGQAAEDAAKKEGKKEQEPPERKEPEKPLTEKEYGDLMDREIKGAWNKLKINDRKKMAEKAAEAADDLAKAAVKILRYDGAVLNGETKGQKAREQENFKQWVEDLKQHAQDYAGHARKRDWDKAAVSKDKINETCGACHELYEAVK